MFSLVITLVAIALAVALSLAAIFYGVPALKEAGAKARATALVEQSAQVLGAAELFFVERKSWPSSAEELVQQAYLKGLPVFRGAGAVPTEWTQPMPQAPTFWVLRSTDADACRQVNLKARGDNGVYRRARAGLLTQCFGESAPFTTVTTRSGLSGANAGLDVVIEFFDDPSLGYAPDGGGWALEPTGVGGTPIDPGTAPDSGTSGGAFLDGKLQISLPGHGGIGSNTVNVGSVSSNGTIRQELQLSNSGSTPWTVGAVRTCGDFRVGSSTCSGTLQPGQSCSVVVEAGPYPSLIEPRVLQGCIEMDTSEGSVRVPLTGSVQPSAPGPVQIGVTTQDPRDTANLLIFPDTEVGQTSYKWVRVQNVGDRLTYGSPPLVLSAPFSVVESTCSGQQAVNEYCQARLAFSPTAAVLYAGDDHPLQLKANGRTVQVGLSGKGVPKPVAGVSVLPAQLDLGSVFALGQYTSTVTVRNNGDTVLSLKEIPSITAGEDAWRVSATTCGATIARNGSCSISLQFSPDVARVFEGQLRLVFAEQSIGEKVVRALGTAINPLLPKDLLIAEIPVGRSYTSSPDLGDGWSLGTGVALVKSQLQVSLDPSTPLPEGLVFDALTRRVTGTPVSVTAQPVQFKMRAIYLGKFVSEKTFAMSVGYYWANGAPSLYSSTSHVALGTANKAPFSVVIRVAVVGGSPGPASFGLKIHDRFNELTLEDMKRTDLGGNNPQPCVSGGVVSADGKAVSPCFMPESPGAINTFTFKFTVTPKVPGSRVMSMYAPDAAGDWIEFYSGNGTQWQNRFPSVGWTSVVP